MAAGRGLDERHLICGATASEGGRASAASGGQRIAAARASARSHMRT